MLGLSADAVASPRPKKKAKIAGPRLSGVSREVAQLLGERAAPIPLAEPTVYRKKMEYNNELVNWYRIKQVHAPVH